MQVLQMLWVLWPGRGGTHRWQGLQRACEQGQGLEMCPCLTLLPSIVWLCLDVAVPAVSRGWEQLSVVSAAMQRHCAQLHEDMSPACHLWGQ